MLASASSAARRRHPHLSTVPAPMTLLPARQGLKHRPRFTAGLGAGEVSCQPLVLEGGLPVPHHGALTPPAPLPRAAPQKRPSRLFAALHRLSCAVPRRGTVNDFIVIVPQIGHPLGA